MRYLISRYKQQQREISYRIYVTDALYFIGAGQRPAKRYIDIIGLHRSKKEDTRSGDDIAKDVILRADLKAAGGE